MPGIYQPRIGIGTRGFCGQRNWIGSIAAKLILLAGVLATSSLQPLRAQDVDVSVGQSEPPYYVGQPAIIQFNVAGFDE